MVEQSKSMKYLVKELPALLDRPKPPYQRHRTPKPDAAPAPAPTPARAPFGKYNRDRQPDGAVKFKLSNMNAHSKCARESECRYSHDAQVIRAARQACLQQWKTNSSATLSNINILNAHFPLESEANDAHGYTDTARQEMLTHLDTLAGRAQSADF